MKMFLATMLLGLLVAIAILMTGRSVEMALISVGILVILMGLLVSVVSE